MVHLLIFRMTQLSLNLVTIRTVEFLCRRMQLLRLKRLISSNLIVKYERGGHIELLPVK